MAWVPAVNDVTVMDAAVPTPRREPEVCTPTVPNALPVVLSVKVTEPVGLELFAAT
jgi:hypothetical protein